jgi:hypothetical protein
VALENNTNNFNERHPVTRAATPNQKPTLVIPQAAWSTLPILQPTTKNDQKPVPPTSHPLNQCMMHINTENHANHKWSYARCQCVGMKVDNGLTEQHVASIFRMTHSKAFGLSIGTNPLSSLNHFRIYLDMFPST